MLRVALSPNKIAFSGIFSYGVQLINVFARKGTVEPGEPSRPAEDPVEQEVLKQPMPMFPQLNIPTAILDRTKRLAEMCTGPVYSRQTSAFPNHAPSMMRSFADPIPRCFGCSSAVLLFRRLKTGISCWRCRSI